MESPAFYVDDSHDPASIFVLDYSIIAAKEMSTVTGFRFETFLGDVAEYR